MADTPVLVMSEGFPISDGPTGGGACHGSCHAILTEPDELRGNAVKGEPHAIARADDFCRACGHDVSGKLNLFSVITVTHENVATLTGFEPVFSP